MAQNLKILRLLLKVYQDNGDTAMIAATKATINSTIATIAWGE